MDIQTIPFAIPLTKPAYMDPNLVLWLTFYSTNAKDHSRFGNHGSIIGPTWVKDRFGAVLNFDGVDDYLEVAHSESLDLNEEISIETCFNIYKYHPMNSQVIINKYEHNKAGFIFGIDVNFGNKLNFTLVGGAKVETKRIIADYLLPLQKWSHTVAVKDSQNEMRMYVNGIQQSQTEIFSNPYSISLPLMIGKYSYMCFGGLISEVRIYNRALTPNEIRRRFRGDI